MKMKATHTWIHAHANISPFCNLNYEKENKPLSRMHSSSGVSNEEHAAQKKGYWYDMCFHCVLRMPKINIPKTTFDNLFSEFLSVERTRDNRQQPATTTTTTTAATETQKNTCACLFTRSRVHQHIDERMNERTKIRSSPDIFLFLFALINGTGVQFSYFSLY